MSTPNSVTDIVCGIDVGGTRTKCGLVDLAGGRVLATTVFDTEREDEGRFLDSIATAVRDLADAHGEPRAAGVSIGSYVFADGSIDGMSTIVRFLTHGYPLADKVASRLGIPVRVDNDARLICLAEAQGGQGRGFSRVLTLTLGTGVGVGLCEGGRPVGRASDMHLAGHIMVREPLSVPELDDEACYCGLGGCFESTCSGTSLARVVRARLGEGRTNADLFRLAREGDAGAREVVEWYLCMLGRALNQYVYLYRPDVIVLGGGVARGLEPYAARIARDMVAEVYEGQRTEVRVTELREDSGVIGAASLLAR